MNTKNTVWIALLLLLNACANPPAYRLISNDDLTQISSCDAVLNTLSDAETKRSILEDQRRRTHTGNAVLAGAGLLSLNPFVLLETRHTGEISEQIDAFQQRILLLRAKEQQLCRDDAAPAQTNEAAAEQPAPKTDTPATPENTVPVKPSE